MLNFVSCIRISVFGHQPPKQVHNRNDARRMLPMYNNDVFVIGKQVSRLVILKQKSE